MCSKLDNYLLYNINTVCFTTIQLPLLFYFLVIVMSNV